MYTMEWIEWRQQYRAIIAGMVQTGEKEAQELWYSWLMEKITLLEQSQFQVVYPKEMYFTEEAQFMH